MVTLTYSDENLPMGPDGPELDYHDVQVFLKRIRRDMDNDLRYYIAGEYGEKYGRPHWHMVLYGADYLEGARRKGGEGMARFASSRMDEIWEKGQTDIVPVSPASCAYAAGYVNKKAGEEGIFRQSRKPPIAKPWVQENLGYLIDRSRIDGLVGVGYNRHPIPKVYLEWFPDELSEIIDRNKEHVTQHKRLNEEANRNREKNHLAKLNIRNLKKSI